MQYLNYRLKSNRLKEIQPTPSSCQKMHSLEQQDEKGETAIFHAVRANNFYKLNMMLRCRLNLFHQNKMGQTAADIAYQIKSWRSLLLLVRNGSTFPEGFNPLLIPENESTLIDLVEQTNNISITIATGQTRKVLELIDIGLLTNSFRNIKNQSAVLIAFLARQLETYVLLKSRGFKELWGELPIDIKQLSCLERFALKNIMALYVKKSQQIIFSSKNKF